MSERSATLACSEYAPDHLEAVVQLWRDAFEHGFIVLERGFEQTWQLEDVKYGWSRAG